MHLPLAFVPNQGQSEAAVLFEANTANQTFAFTAQEIQLQIKGQSLHLSFIDASQSPSLTADTLLPGKINDFRGSDPERWHTNIPTYAGISYQQLYPGIDLRYEGADGLLKSTFTVAPGANPARIRWQYSSAAAVTVDDATGDLLVTLPDQTQLVEKMPVAWQDIDGRRVSIPVAYALADDATVGFELGDYDVSHPFVIDPTIVYETNIDLGGFDRGQDIVIDAAGNAYVLGMVIDASNDVFVTKLSPDGTLLYVTYLRGSGVDFGGGIALDSAADVYIAGATDSADFPILNAMQSEKNGVTREAFIAKVRGTDGSLQFSTFFGGSRSDEIHDITLNGADEVYVVGYTESTDFPTLNPIQAGLNLNQCFCEDTFVTKLTSDAMTLLYGTYLGGSFEDYGESIALDGNDNIYITGRTQSDDYPTQAAIQPNRAGEFQDEDIFVSKIAADGSHLVYSTYLGGTENDFVRRIAVDDTGNAFVAGSTRSADFPTTAGAFQETYVGGFLDCGTAGFGGPRNCEDMFVTKLAPDGSSLVYSTYMGGGLEDQARGIAINDSGEAFVVGFTDSSDFPGSTGNEPHVIVLLKLDASGSYLLYTTSIASATYNAGHGIALDAAGDVYITASKPDLLVAKFADSGTQPPPPITNNPPIAVDDSASTAEVTSVTIDVAANDSDPDGNLDPTSANTACASCSDTGNGNLVNYGDGSFEYTPNPNFNGLDGFTYEICDTLGACDTALVSITVSPSAPVITEVRVAASSDDAEENGSGNVSLGSSDLELVFTSNSNQIVGMRFNGMTIPQGAHIDRATIQFQVDESRNNNPSALIIRGEAGDNAATFTSANSNISSRPRTSAAISWTPPTWSTVGQAGPEQQTPNVAAVIQEVVNRPGWASGNSLVIIITGTGKRVAEAYNGDQAGAPLLHVEYTTGPPNTNNPPIAVDDSASTPEDTSVTIDVAANDSDPDGDLDLASANTGCSNCGAPANGTLVNNNDGTFDYTPNPSFNGSDSFVYEICDSVGACDTALVSISVTQTNDPPAAGDDVASTPEDTAVTIDVAANDSDPDGNLDATSANTACTGCATPANGSLANNGDGTFTYTPNPNFNGSDSFVYEICDALNACDTATVSITVDPVADAPVANDDGASTSEATAVTIDVAANDGDPDGNLNPGSATRTSDPSNGNLVNHGDGTFTYTPSPGFSGSDSFTYEICDFGGLCDTATVNITVNPSAAPPVPVVDAVSSGITGDTILNIPHTTSTGEDRLMLVSVAINNGGGETVSSVTYGGVPLTHVGTVIHLSSGGDDSLVEMWRLVAPSPGTSDVVITFSSTLQYYAVGGVITLTGVDQVDPLGTFVGNYGDASTAILTVPSDINHMVLGAFACETCTSVGFSPPAEEQWNMTSERGRLIGAGGTVLATGPQVTVSASLGKGDHWAMAGISIRPAR